ncbi:MAG TPA: 30S ribosome-binding factor RbfA [Gammaproteobacteria bacterium]|jgi:ribosome-binding factor A|nr:30S ribosome-binding factor RbfA [Gammaproteobacteria bacterium]
MPRDFPRTRRIGEQMQRELAALIRDSVKDPRVGMVTVSAVEVTRDLAHAKVFVTVLGDETARRDTMTALASAAGFLRHELGQRMLTRTVPQLRFVYDESIEHGTRLSALIDAAVASDHHDDD